MERKQKRTKRDMFEQRVRDEAERMIKEKKVAPTKDDAKKGTPSLFDDIKAMHKKFKVHERIEEIQKEDPDKLSDYLNFRADMIGEEYQELRDAIDSGNVEEVVDSLIDQAVFIVGTLDAMKVDGQKAWDQVQKANMSKKTGVKEGRPNKFGFPDLIKPKNWKAPSHKGNYGILESFDFSKDKDQLKLELLEEEK